MGRLVGTDVAGAFAVAIGTRLASLVGGRTTAQGYPVDGFAAFVQSHGLCGSTIVAQKTKIWVCAVEVGMTFEATGGPAIQIVAFVRDRPMTILGTLAIRHNGPCECDDPLMLSLAMAPPLPVASR